MSKKRTAWLLAAVASTSAMMSAAHATISFNLIGLSSLPANAQSGFQAAANRWAGALDVVQNGTSANITLNIQVGFTALQSGVIAQTNPMTNDYWYTQFRTGLN